jgi:2-deoxy-D-gluconate 3-dehydrogenase
MSSTSLSLLYSSPHICVAYAPLTNNLFQGIGAACALALAQAGASICLVQRNPAEGVSPNLETLNSIRALGVSAEVVFCDLDDLEAVKQIFQKALDVMNGQIHILVNCAGIQRRSPIVDFSESDWDDVRIAIWGALPCIFL